jgi:uncharacterized RDD family membrane protein YckC
MNAIAQASAGPVSGSKLDNRRVLAGLIDVAIVAVGGAVILAAAGALGQSPSEFGGGLSLVILGWGLYYYFALESGNGQTVGKRVTNIRVVSMDGSPAGMREIGLRTVLRVVDGLFLYLVGLVVMMATGERRGRLGDLAGGTKIVSADAPSAPMAAPVAAEPASRVPIAESGPAFAPVAVEEPVEADEAEAEPASAEAEPASAEDEVSSPALQSLAADVSAVTSDPDRVVEEAEEPIAEAEEEPAAETEEEPVAETAEADDGDEADEVEAVEAEEVEAVEVDEVEAVEADEVEAVEADEVEAEEVDEVEADEVDEVEAVEDQDVEAEADDDSEDDDREVSVRSVQTVSAMDIVMGDDDRS